jgi:hypothetical protein
MIQIRENGFYVFTKNSSVNKSKTKNSENNLEVIF